MTNEFEDASTVACEMQLPFGFPMLALVHMMQARVGVDGGWRGWLGMVGLGWWWLSKADGGRSASSAHGIGRHSAVTLTLDVSVLFILHRGQTDSESSSPSCATPAKETMYDGEEIELGTQTLLEIGGRAKGRSRNNRP